MSENYAKRTELQPTFNAYIQQAIRINFTQKALTDYNGYTCTYGEVGNDIAMLHSCFASLGIKKGDKIALLAKNSANWCKIYLAVITYKAVIVPILPDFSPTDIHSIINHSDSVLLFSEESIFKTIDIANTPNINLVIRVKDFSVLQSPKLEFVSSFKIATEKYREEYPKGINIEDVNYPEQDLDELLVISYTSGTSGFSKGVMIPQRSLHANIEYARDNMLMNQGERILSFLPLAHTFGCAEEFLFPFTRGCHITFLTRIPSPSLIIEAFDKVKPNLILSVPLIIEKIYLNKIRPIITKPIMKLLLVIPFFNRLILNKIKQKLKVIFGGEFRELVIGGAAFNPEAEIFFRKMRFPFTIGYGMTECGPLISYTKWQDTELHGSGKIVDALEVKISSSNPEKISGEILVKGLHTMLGYYKNEEATKAVLDDDGWLHTGDMGTIDKKGNIFIRGRLKSMILSASGQNVYPEEIEAVLANYPLFLEVLVVDRKHKPFALIFPNADYIKKHRIKPEDLNTEVKDTINAANQHLATYMKVSDFEIMKKEFEKTPKKNIKRFKYS